MWRFIIYKEWLKIRWFLIGYLILGILGIGYLFLGLKHSLEFEGSRNLWSKILFLNLQFYSSVKYVPLIAGILLAFVQYLPEAINKRIKLTFHLPLGENRALMLMQAFGAGCLLIEMMLFFGLFTGISLIYFPMQLISDSLATILPWSLAGFAAYFIGSLVILEPNPVFRFCYSLIGVSFLTIYFAPADTASYQTANAELVVLTALLSFAFLFSAHRFRKGEV